MKVCVAFFPPILLIERNFLFLHFSEYLCPRSANKFDIQFVCFRVRNMEDQQVLFEITKPEEEKQEEEEEHQEEDYGRFIRYDFPPQLLNLKALGAT